MRRFRLDALAATPWRNGGGLTYEIAAGAVDGRQGTAWDWRISVASIRSDGPFSIFPGVDRVATLVEGALSLHSVATHLAWTLPGDTHAFRGEDALHCRVLPTGARLLNVMTSRARLRARVDVHFGHAPLGRAHGVTGCWLVLDGRFDIHTSEGLMRLEAGEGGVGDLRVPEAQADLQTTSGCLVEVQFLSPVL